MNQSFLFGSGALWILNFFCLFKQTTHTLLLNYRLHFGIFRFFYLCVSQYFFHSFDSSLHFESIEIWDQKETLLTVSAVVSARFDLANRVFFCFVDMTADLQAMPPFYKFSRVTSNNFRLMRCVIDHRLTDISLCRMLIRSTCWFSTVKWV